MCRSSTNSSLGSGFFYCSLKISLNNPADASPHVTWSEPAPRNQICLIHSCLCMVSGSLHDCLMICLLTTVRSTGMLLFNAVQSENFRLSSLGLKDCSSVLSSGSKHPVSLSLCCKRCQLSRKDGNTRGESSRCRSRQMREWIQNE